jgi:Tfp pilus assembly protein PilF
MNPSDVPQDPDDLGRAQLAEAYRLYEANDFEAALAACDEALVHLPMLAEAFNLRGVVLEELGRETEAVAAYGEALVLEPDFAEPRENLRQIERKQGHLAEAYRQWEGRNFAAGLAACDAALQHIPISAEAHNLRGILLEELGRPQEALQAYTTAVHLDPDLADAAENLEGLRNEWRARFGLTTIAASDFPLVMHILKGRLEAEGIPAFVADEEVITLYWIYARALGGAKLQVWRQDAERAMDILGIGWRAEMQDDEEAEEEQDLEPAATEYDESVDTPDRDGPLTWEELSALAEGYAPDQKAVVVHSAQANAPSQCPECNSENISYRRFDERFFFLTWLLIKFPLPILRRRWRCLSCGHEWRTHS